MCTVVFIPEKNKNIFASLRDENPARPAAISPAYTRNHPITFLAPQDALGGGTWIGVNDSETIIILLNGGFSNHISKNQYKKSRGLIVTDLLATSMPIIHWELLDLTDIEPFTLVVWSERMLFHLVWDGLQKFRIKLNSAEAHIFSSSTLYNKQAKENRQAAFQKWLSKHPDVTQASLLSFFNSIPDCENGFIINRSEKIKTLSYSYVELSNHAVVDFYYTDFQHQLQIANTISMKTTISNNLATFI
ncbi:MAG: hypothetical protein RLY16_1470 [Bacteroidota bacterium]